ncbi:hypothetical protein [Arthrobacter sp. UM1]|uniref:hypothetical protein n=1 Tax=Arthrobacter sp. UM1 TaxID=2766776 RepID=UPI001CF6BB6B|nr:hypothetical protein [Arthrobacter sp. UM1]MCB4209120.1 hypothetical protein [Arthrobacter sp. UM1]
MSTFQGDRRGLGRGLAALAAVYLVFGLGTVFWGQPSEAAAGVVAGAFSLALAGALFLTRLALVGSAEGTYRPEAGMPFALPVIGAAALVGLVQAVLHSSLSASVLAGAVWILTGAAQLWWMLAERRASAAPHPLSKDWLVAGAVSLVTGVWLLFVRDLGAHGQLGISGGAAIITGMLWTISALTLALGEQKPAPGPR